MSKDILFFPLAARLPRLTLPAYNLIPVGLKAAAFAMLI